MMPEPGIIPVHGPPRSMDHAVPRTPMRSQDLIAELGAIRAKLEDLQTDPAELSRQAEAIDRSLAALRETLARSRAPAPSAQPGAARPE